MRKSDRRPEDAEFSAGEALLTWAVISAGLWGLAFAGIRIYHFING